MMKPKITLQLFLEDFLLYLTMNDYIEKDFDFKKVSRKYIRRVKNVK